MKLLLILLFTSYVRAEDPVFHSNIGKFYGKLLEFEDGSKVDAFYGVPFAKAPIGELRFEKPEDAEYVEERDAKALAPICPQPDYGWGMDKNEDCLYVNIFRPHAKPKQNYPILFFIHGGAFQGGSSFEVTTNHTAEHFSAMHQVTTVFPQYRLGIFGFGSTNSADFPGNYGLWDLQKALQFVHKNGDELYGNVNQITVGGYSAGAAATGALTYSEHTRDMFKQSIQFSGSIFAEWALSERSVVYTQKVIDLLQCNVKNVKQCLKSKSTEDLKTASIRAHDATGDINSFDYTPRLDGDFFTTDVPDLVAKAPPKPSLMSLTEHEGLFFTLYFPRHIEIFHHSLNDTEREDYDREDFLQFASEVIVPRKLFNDKHDEIVDKIAKFYLSDEEKAKDNPHYYIDARGKLLGDVMFNIPQLMELEKRRENGWQLYHLLSTHNDYFEAKAPHVEILTSTHTFEFYYLFGHGYLGHHEFTEEDYIYKKLLLDAVINFIKTGSPKSDENPNFVQIDAQNPLTYTELSTRATVKKPLFEEEMRFWKELLESYEFDVIRGIHKETKKIRNEL
ncbi:unnamed protein product [Bursaphelenchus okinawaensis]|uniref:Carboxylesterase type B domain-containing protein n=1 Tax=Bursaphelenchus okinawaensis TaxID=465554 RepID=A0A811LA26_9BILA|nr:unnamed protein product [Bursaphelenchus okinawaensis]CAG9120420.1 unnamed protein product [Bursaphelenchus okinawaensis]